MRIVMLLLLASCATETAKKADANYWQDEMNGAIDRSREQELIDSGYYARVRCPAAQRPEWASASATDKGQWLKDCRRLAELVDAGVVH